MDYVVSTSTTPGTDAMNVAWDWVNTWLQNGIPDEGNALDMITYTAGGI